MTPDRTSLSSISPPPIPITVQTADGSSLSVAGQGALLPPYSFVSLFSCSCCFLCSQTNHAAYLS
jgi:hypothetical protein